MFNKKKTSHVILMIFLIGILISGFAFSYTISSFIKDMATNVSKNMKDIMDPKVPDSGKTASESFSVPTNSKKVIIGTYLERIEDLNIKESYWTYEFYLWFKWNPNEIDFLGEKSLAHQNELPFTVINGEILKTDLVDRYTDSINKVEYIQYYVKAKSTQFFDVSLYPIDKHDLIIPIEHKWIDRKNLYFEPDTKDSKVSSRVMVNGYEKDNSVKMIEKPHAYKSARGNPKFSSDYKVDFSQYRMAVRIYKGGISVILKLFLILYIAVLVTFIAPFAPDPSRYTVGALFTAAGGSYILASKLPSTNVFSLAEIINAFCIVLIVAMIAILGILPALIFKDGVIDSFEKKMTRLINLVMFIFFILINSSLIYFALSYS
jgi:hypothetical protein